MKKFYIMGLIMIIVCSLMVGCNSNSENSNLNFSPVCQLTIENNSSYLIENCHWGNINFGSIDIGKTVSEETLHGQDNIEFKINDNWISLPLIVKTENVKFIVTDNFIEQN